MVFAFNLTPSQAARCVAVQRGVSITLHRAVAALIVYCIAGFGLPAWADAPSADRDGSVDQRINHHIDMHLNQLGARLEIKASQEPAWQAFRGAFADYMTPSTHGARTDRAALDAAALAKWLADRAADRAQKLGKLADATVRLQQTLEPDQRLVLNEAAHRFVHRDLGRPGPDGRGGHGEACEERGMPPGHPGMHSGE